MSDNVSVTLLVKTIGRKKGDVVLVDQATADRLVFTKGARLTPVEPPAKAPAKSDKD